MNTLTTLIGKNNTPCLYCNLSTKEKHKNVYCGVHDIAPRYVTTTVYKPGFDQCTACGTNDLFNVPDCHQRVHIEQGFQPDRIISSFCIKCAIDPQRILHYLPLLTSNKHVIERLLRGKGGNKLLNSVVQGNLEGVVDALQSGIGAFNKDITVLDAAIDNGHFLIAVLLILHGFKSDREYLPFVVGVRLYDWENMCQLAIEHIVYLVRYSVNVRSYVFRVVVTVAKLRGLEEKLRAGKYWIIRAGLYDTDYSYYSTLVEKREANHLHEMHVSGYDGVNRERSVEEIRCTEEKEKQKSDQYVKRRPLLPWNDPNYVTLPQRTTSPAPTPPTSIVEETLVKKVPVWKLWLND